MTPLFIDSDALYALNNTEDPSHYRAIEIVNAHIANNRYHSITGMNIVMETATIISQRVGKQNALNFLNELRSGQYTIINPDERIIMTAEEIFKKIPSKNVSYSDCISFAIMKSYNISTVFSFDEHFKQQGFKRIGIDK